MSVYPRRDFRKAPGIPHLSQTDIEARFAAPTKIANASAGPASSAASAARRLSGAEPRLGVAYPYHPNQTGMDPVAVALDECFGR